MRVWSLLTAQLRKAAEDKNLALIQEVQELRSQLQDANEHAATVERDAKQKVGKLVEELRHANLQATMRETDLLSQIDRVCEKCDS